MEAPSVELASDKLAEAVDAPSDELASEQPAEVVEAPSVELASVELPSVKPQRADLLRQKMRSIAAAMDGAVLASEPEPEPKAAPAPEPEPTPAPTPALAPAADGDAQLVADEAPPADSGAERAVFVDGDGGWEALQDEDGDTYYYQPATGEVSLGLGRIVALYHRSSTSYQIC